MKDHCTWFPESVFGIYIGDICKFHDDTCSFHSFYDRLVKRLEPLTFNHEIAFIIAAGGTIGCFVQYPKRIIKRI